MNIYLKCKVITVLTLLIATSLLAKNATESLPVEVQQVMAQDKYKHAFWGIYLKDLQTGEVRYDVNSDKLFSPASTTKLFSVAALLHNYGDDYRFKTPVYARGAINDGVLQGNLVLVAQGDLTFGGRQPNANTIAYTKMDHIIANEVPGAILTPENPLTAIDALAEQVAKNGIKEVHGDIVIDDSLFEKTEKRGMMLTPIMINENLIDMVINPSQAGQAAAMSWRPQVEGYTVTSKVQTVAQDDALNLRATADPTGHHITIEGTVPIGQKNVVHTFSIRDPKAFARAAFIQALAKHGVKVVAETTLQQDEKANSPQKNEKPIALWVSPPLSQYAKLILKVSHNLGANLVPPLLAVHAGKKTYDEGMLLLGDFALQQVKLSPNEFVFFDAAGGNENRLTPQAEIQMLEYAAANWQPQAFKDYMNALPILGVDGSLEDFAKSTPAVGKVYSKPGTGVSQNLATGNFFLITQALAGYIQGKNGHLWAYIVVVNNGAMPTIEDIFPIFEDESNISNSFYLQTAD